MATGVALGARRLTGSQDQLLASERAAEAVETVFKARDNRVLTWAQIRNVNGATGTDGGVFLDGPQSIRDPGPDGLVNTADDGAVRTSSSRARTACSARRTTSATPLFGFTREIEIRDITRDAAPDSRDRAVPQRRTAPAQYILLTYLSAYA